MEAVVIVPVLMLVVLVAVQVGLWTVADEAVQQVASHTALVAAGVGGTTSAAETAGLADAQSLAGPVVVDPTVAVTVLDPDTVEAVVSGRAESILPWFRPVVRAVRQATVQRFRAGP